MVCSPCSPSRMSKSMQAVFCKFAMSHSPAPQKKIVFISRLLGVFSHVHCAKAGQVIQMTEKSDAYDHGLPFVATAAHKTSPCCCWMVVS